MVGLTSDEMIFIRPELSYEYCPDVLSQVIVFVCLSLSRWEYTGCTVAIKDAPGSVELQK